MSVNTTQTHQSYRGNSQLCDRHWRSFRDAGDPIPAVWHPHFIIDFWLNRCRFYRDFYCEVVLASPLLRMAKG